jgi:hypothetical protein
MDWRSGGYPSKVDLFEADDRRSKGKLTIILHFWRRIRIPTEWPGHPGRIQNFHQAFQSMVHLCFSALFGPLASNCAQAFGTGKRSAAILLRDGMVAWDSTSTTWSISILYLTLSVLILSATCGRIATVGIDLAVDRDWCVVKRLLKRSSS